MPEDVSLTELLQDLTPDQAAQLSQALRRLRRQLASGEALQLGAIIIRKQVVRCGKARCRCNAAVAAAAGVPPSLHGPYWYAWWWSAAGQKRSAYVGREVRRKRVDAQVRVLEGLAMTLAELEELAAVTDEELDRGWAGEAPGDAARARLAAALARGELSRRRDGKVDAPAAITWLEALGALGFRQRRRRG
ncbi:DUF6788 family protein [Pyxidicoccus sp. MSG2]|uniref:DUF6788 family protein n=1 Tax=Pyxidicoccus sp. MSG2 TaxID=2996790 RepID=UPI0022701A72|nr:DUF6788 family protein [Pyxidicoccus sp. MSG2]MCY1023940.1 hypothetical protein [Pyxidicoccus sp. MSG2]